MYPTIIIPSMNEDLCKKAMSFIPGEWPVIVKDGNPLTHFDEIKKLNISTKWAINVDEDCFITDPSGVVNLIEVMERDGYDTAGIQDGSSYIRHHNPVMFNPFFFVFNVESVQAAPKVAIDDLSEMSKRFQHFIKFNHLPHKYDGFEPYYPFFLDLLCAGLKPLFLQNHAYEAYPTDSSGLGKPSIVLGEDGKELAIHSWYSRLYNLPAVQERIRICEEYAKSNPACLVYHGSERARSRSNDDLLSLIPSGFDKLIVIGRQANDIAGSYKNTNKVCDVVCMDLGGGVTHEEGDETPFNAEMIDDVFFENMSDRTCWVLNCAIERLKNPWEFLARIKKVMPAGGCVVAYMPNAQYWMLQAKHCIGDLRYEDTGVFDRENLRWFTRATLLELFRSAGFAIAEGHARVIDEPAREKLLPIIRMMAEAVGADGDLAVNDSIPLGYVVRAIHG